MASFRFASGLVVGKFAPLHLGHELLIQRALEACARVVVFSFTKPELPGCPPQRRKAWLDARSPRTQNVVFGADGFVAGIPAEPAAIALARAMPREGEPEDRHRRYVGELCLRFVGPVDAVFTSEDYGDGFAAVLTEQFRAREPHRAAVQHVQVDRARQLVPVSGTVIRRDPHGQRAYLGAEVYADFVARVCILGGESTGKTTLAAALAERFATQWVPEYGRELWVERDGRLTFADMLHIGEAQVAREAEYARRARRYLFCDTSPLTTACYSEMLFGAVDPRLRELAARSYAHTILCAPDFAFVQDGTRQDAAFAQRQHDYYLAALARAGVPFQLVRGSVAERVAQVVAADALAYS